LAWQAQSKKVQMSLELIIGPMFAGKTSVLQSIHRRWKSLGFICVAYKPQIDTRYSIECISSHDQIHIAATCVATLMDRLPTEEYKSAQLILIEEGQFFPDLFDFVMTAVEKDGKQVVVAGLDGDRFRKPFGDILRLIPLADRIQKLTAFCSVCRNGTPALFSFGSIITDDLVVVGQVDLYRAVCRKHYLELEFISKGAQSGLLKTM
jgi:thymidine kinase